MSQPSIPGFSWRHLGFAALAGVLATVALLLSPFMAGVPPIIPPYVPIDLRLVALPLGFSIAYLLGLKSGWPGPATGLLAAALLSAVGSHIHAAAALDFVGATWAQPGTRVNVFSMAASIGSVLLGLQVALEAGQTRTLAVLRERGVPDEELAQAANKGDALRSSAVATAGVGALVLTLGLRIGDQITGQGSLPLPEVFALAVVLALGALLIGLDKTEPIPDEAPES